MAARLSALRAGRFLHPGKEELKTTEKSNDLTGN
jgi:hypothetical protein